MKSCEVSVVIPVYNGEKTIRRAVDSALEQKVSLEILVIDDASGDATGSVMKRYETVPEVRYIRNEKNQGVAAGRNLGVTLAKGRYIAFLDADDFWAPGKLERQIALMKEKGTVLCCTGRELILPDGRSTGKVIPVSEKITYKSLLRGNAINCSSVVARREILREFPMEHDDCHEDYLTWLRILRKYGEVCGIPEPLLKYQVSSSGKSGSKLQSAVMTYQVYRYLGLGRIRALICFCGYAWNGFRKYYLRG